MAKREIKDKGLALFDKEMNPPKVKGQPEQSKEQPQEKRGRPSREGSFKRFTYWLDPRLDVELDMIKLDLKRKGAYKSKSDLIREVVEDLVKKYR